METTTKSTIIDHNLAHPMILPHPSHSPTTPLPILPKPPPPSQSKRSEMKDLEYVFVEQATLSTLEEEGTMDRRLPILGLLYGTTSSDGDRIVLTTVQRLPRDVKSLHEHRRIIPREADITSLNGRIRDDGSVLVGYFYSECESEIYSVDHAWMCKVLGRVECTRPILLRIRRLLCGSLSEEVEAGVRFDIYSIKASEILVPVALKILDATFMTPSTFQNIMESDRCSLEELLSQGRNQMSDLEYDVALSKLLISVESRVRHLISNLQSRLTMEKVLIKELLRDRMSALESQWSHKTNGESSMEPDLVSAEGVDSGQRAAMLLGQLVCKELPHAYTDAVKKLPIVNNISFHERPNIAMKPLKTAIMPVNQNTISSIQDGEVKIVHGMGPVKKRARFPSVKVAPQSKGPPRPILPAVTGIRSRTPSSESILSRPDEDPISESIVPPTTEQIVVTQDETSTL